MSADKPVSESTETDDSLHEIASQMIDDAFSESRNRNVGDDVRVEALQADFVVSLDPISLAALRRIVDDQARVKGLMLDRIEGRFWYFRIHAKP